MAIPEDTTKSAGESQSDKFKELFRELKTDEDEARWDDRMRNVAKAKLEPEKPE